MSQIMFFNNYAGRGPARAVKSGHRLQLTREFGPLGSSNIPKLNSRTPKALDLLIVP
jgi:hypothetical protein